VGEEKRKKKKKGESDWWKDRRTGERNWMVHGRQEGYTLERGVSALL